MRQHEDRMRDAGATLVLVGMGSVRESAAFKERFEIPFPLVADPEGELYRAYDLSRLGPVGLFSVSMLVKGVSAMAGGHRIGRPVGDVRQLPGVFVIDRGGAIRFSHHSAGPEDHPPPEAILAALEEMEG